jgi:uncharacterized membrane protein YoaK (UPF0700 family)
MTEIAGFEQRDAALLNKENFMKKISLAGVIVGMIVGALAAMVSGSWIFWLGAGTAIGLFLGAAQARRGRGHETREGANS